MSSETSRSTGSRTSPRGVNIVDERPPSRARGERERAARIRLSDALGSRVWLPCPGDGSPCGGAAFSAAGEASLGVMIRLGLGVRSSLGAGEAKLLAPLRIMRLEYSRLVGLKVAARNVRFGSRRRSVHECCACALSLSSGDGARTKPAAGSRISGDGDKLLR